MEFNAMDPSLYQAAASGDLRFLKEVMGANRSAILLQKTPNNNSVLHIAAQFKQTDFFKEFPNHLRSSLFCSTNIKGDTPMHVAARVGCVELVEFLIDHARKLPTDAADVESGPADAEAYKELLRMTNSEKDTALHVAVKCGHQDVVILLMDADPELSCYTNNANESPLFLAVTKGFLNIASCILDKSPASLSFEGVQGVTALHAAVTRKSTCKDIVGMMVSRNPEIIKAVDELGWTPLHYAAFKGNVEAVTLLVQGDSSVAYILDKWGMSALHVAAHASRIKVMKELIRLRPDICDLHNHKGQTVLHAAVLGGMFLVVEYILETPGLAGLVNQADNDGNTPLHLAAYNRNIYILGLMGRDCKVDKTATNNQSLKVSDIFVADNCKPVPLSRHKSLHYFGKTIGVPTFQRYICRSMELKSSEENKAATFTTAAIENDSKSFETNLLVAMLMATVTFSAAFTMPGGFNSHGMAILHRRIFFILFVSFDSISFFLALFVVFNHFMVSNSSFVNRSTHPTAAMYIRYSLAAMVVAFASGMFVVLPNYSPLGIVVILICSILCCVIIRKSYIYSITVNNNYSSQRRSRFWVRSRII